MPPNAYPASIDHARRTFAGIAPLLLAFAACADDDGAPIALVRDSAGVTIVENPAPATAAVRSVSDPVLRIGAVAGPEEYELHDVTGVVRLSDGSIAVATGGDGIRWFDENGVYLRRTGREGGGPGEYRGIRYMRALAGDSLLVYDGGNRRVSVVAPDGSYVRGRGIGMAEDRPIALAGALLDGTVLTRTMVETPPTATPLYRVRMEYALSRGDETMLLREYPGPEAALHAEGAGGGIGSVFISVLPFARGVHAAAGADRFFVGSSDAYRIDVWDGTGRLVMIVRAAVPVTPVTEDIREAYIASEIERRRRQAEDRGQPFDRTGVLQLLRDEGHAPALPVFSSMITTADGELWVKDFIMPGAEPRSERWTIFDAEGRLASVVDLPARFTPTHVQGPLVLGVWRDSLDVPYVQAHTLR